MSKNTDYIELTDLVKLVNDTKKEAMILLYTEPGDYNESLRFLVSSGNVFIPEESFDIDDPDYKDPSNIYGLTGYHFSRDPDTISFSQKVISGPELKDYVAVHNVVIGEDKIIEFLKKVNHWDTGLKLEDTFSDLQSALRMISRISNFDSKKGHISIE